MAVLSRMARSPPFTFSRKNNDTVTLFQPHTRRQLPTPEQVIDAWNSFWRQFFPGLVPPPPPKTTAVTSTASSSNSPPTPPPGTTNSPPPTPTQTPTPTQAQTEQSSAVVTPTATESDETTATTATTATTETVSGTEESSSTDSSSTPTSSFTSSSFPGPVLPASASPSTFVVESTSSSTLSTSEGAEATQTAAISTGDSKQFTTVIAGSTVGGVALVSLVVFALLCLRKRRRRSGEKTSTSRSEISPFMYSSPTSPSPTQTFSATYVSDKSKYGRSYPGPTEGHVEFDHQSRSEREQTDGDGQIYGSAFGVEGNDDLPPPSVAPSHEQSCSSRYSTDEHEEHHEIMDGKGMVEGRSHTSLNYPSSSAAASQISFWDNDDDEREDLYLNGQGLSNSRRGSVRTIATRSDEPLPSSFIIPLTPQRYSAMSAVPVPPIPPSVVASLQPQRLSASSRSGNPLPSPPMQPRRSHGRDSVRKRPMGSFTAALGRQNEAGDRVGEQVDGGELDDDMDRRRRDVESPPPVYTRWA